jgi:hypothetical protein
LVASTLRPHRGVFFNRFRKIPSSGCFLSSGTQVCYFEPFWPWFCPYGYFDSLDFGWSFGSGDSTDPGDDLSAQGHLRSEMSAMPPTGNSEDEDAVAGNSPASPQATMGAVPEDLALDKGVLVLVLKNGTTQAVTDYWVADGYLEYISPDGTRSHIPLDALDLQNTVSRNVPRGLSFVLRSMPAQNR